jgi:hypothetical protein
MLRVVNDEAARAGGRSMRDELCREGCEDARSCPRGRTGRVARRSP